MFKLLSTISRSTILGFWDEAGEWFLNFMVSKSIGPLLWGLCDIFFWVLDIFEDLFKRFAGIHTGVEDAAGNAIEGDLVLYLINSDLVQQIFMSVLILSLFLLIIFTIFAIVKNQYSDKQEPVSKIINSSFKALLMYLLVPVATVVCLMAGNIVLQAIDGATKPSVDATASDTLFIAGVYNANKLRDSELEDNRDTLKKWIEKGYVANIMDEMARIGIRNADDAAMATEEQISYIAILVDEGYVSEQGLTNSGWNSKWNYISVARYYNIFQVSFIIVGVGGVFLIWAIGKITWGLISRLFKMTFYYALSPAVMATFPIDGGKALGSWRGEMVKNGTMAFCSIGVLNILYQVLPFFNGIRLFGEGNVFSGIANALVKLFINIIAFSSAKDLIAAISGWFGTGDALAEGIKASGQVKNAFKKVGGASKKAVGMFGGLRGGIKAAEKTKGNKFMGALQGLYKTSGLSKTQEEFQKTFQDGKKSGADRYKAHRTTRAFSGNVKDKELAEYEAYEIVEKEDKRINEILGKMDGDKKRELLDAILDGHGPGTKEYKEIEEKWDKSMEKVKSTASYLDTLFEDAQRKLEQQQKKNETRQSNFSSFDSLEKGYEQDAEYRKRIETMTGWAGMTDDIWKEVKEGDFSHVDGEYKEKVQEAYGMFASDILSNDHDMQRAKQSIYNLAKSGQDGLKYVSKVLGDKMESMFDVVKDTAGNITSVNKLNDTMDDDAISKKITAEQESINDALKKWEEDNKKYIKDRADKVGELVREDLEKIGKKAGKS